MTKRSINIASDSSYTKLKIGNRTLILTHLSKLFWPDEGVNKGDVIHYYQKIAPFILPYLKDRPMTLKRNPNGIADKGFYQKDAGPNTPEWVSKISIRSGTTNKIVHYIICNDVATLVYLANLGCIEMNPWFSRITNSDYPDYLVIDVDPSMHNTFDQVIETANVTKYILDKCGAPAYCKTSGSTGLHIYVPMGAKYSYDEVRNFAKNVAIKINNALPDITTLERSLACRDPNKIYIDYLQNSKGQTIASAYSLRPKPGVMVSTPVDWKELKPGFDPLQFNIDTLPERVERIGDLFLPVLKKGINLQKCFSNLIHK